MVMMIYTLTDSDGSIRYVGKTSRSPLVRLDGHLKEAQNLPRHSTYKNNWIRSLLAEGKQPHLTVLSCSLDTDGSDLERWYIATFRALGYRLTNTTGGGGGILGYRHTAETRARIAAANLGRIRPHTAAAKAKISAAKKGKPVSAEALAKRIGRKQSTETVEKRIAPLRGRKKSSEVIAKSVAGREPDFHHSAETKARISAALTGRRLDPVRIEAAAVAHRGLKRSEETKRKIAEGVKANWEVRRQRALEPLTGNVENQGDPA